MRYRFRRLRIRSGLTQDVIVVLHQLIATAGEDDRLADTETHGDGVRIGTAIGMRKGNPLNGRRRRVVVVIAVYYRLVPPSTKNCPWRTPPAPAAAKA